MNIRDNFLKIRKEIPDYVQIVLAAKMRTKEEIEEAISAGAEIIGENYVQEAEKAFALIGRRVKWHFIGHLQKNKVKKAVKMFDLIETLDSFELAKEIDKRCANLNKIMPVLCEINIAKEKTKSGVYPEEVETLLKSISPLKYVKVKGLMTMGPRFGDPEEARPYFKKTKEIFERIKKMNIPNIEMKYLSMGMSNTYQVAIEEGANIIRIGTKIFGERIYRGGNK